MWLRILYIPFLIWFIYLVTMMIWNTISPGEPLKFYNKYIKPISTIDKTNISVVYIGYNLWKWNENRQDEGAIPSASTNLDSSELGGEIGSTGAGVKWRVMG
tara:strand:+ start:602 stop:907 length:306 start_codon:yes stop_codon:yes gene_type:complete